MGYFRVGDRLKARSSEVIVTGEDLDGMAVAYKVDYLESFGSLEAGLKVHGSKVPGMPCAPINPAQAEQCKAIAAEGRRRRAISDDQRAAS